MQPIKDELSWNRAFLSAHASVNKKPRDRAHSSAMLLPLFLLLLVPGVFSKSEECKQCEIVVELLHKGWDEESTAMAFGDIVIFLCEEFQIQDNFVCTAMTRSYQNDVDYILGQIIFEPHQICGLLMDDCGNFYDPLNATWSIPIPGGQPKPIEKGPIAPGKPTLRVLHLTDVHMDTQYSPGEEVQCTEPMCCRPLSDPVEMDKRRGVKQAAGHWGTVGHCDVPYWTLINMLQFIDKNHKDLDYVMISGDLESHAVYDYTPETHAAVLKNVSDTIRFFLPKLQVYFAVGNHEGVPMDSFAPHYAPKEYRNDWLYDTMSTAWRGWVPQDQQKTLKYQGCYMVKLFPGLRLISVNNPLGGDSLNVWMLMNQTDPDGTLQWVIDQLKEAESAGDKVHIVAHIPGGHSEALEGWAINYYNVVNRFQNTISAQFFGHTHSDNFYMVYEDPKDYTSRPTGVVFSAPSVTTYSHYHPAYRIYTIDGNYSGSTFEVIDYEEWSFNLTSISDADTNPTWTQLFPSINQVYGFKSQAPAEWNNLLNKMKTDDSLFDTFYHIRMRRNEFDGVEKCRGSCKEELLCNARQFHHDKSLCSDILTNSTSTQAEEKMYVKRAPKPIRAQRTGEEMKEVIRRWRKRQ